MAVFNKFNSFSEAIAKKVHNLGTDTIKAMLTNAVPVATNTVKANITEIGAGNGYTAGGATVTIASASQTAGLFKWVLNDVTITAAGGSIGPFRYVVLYNDTATNKELIGYYDYGSTATLAAGESLTVDFDAVNGVLTLGDQSI